MQRKRNALTSRRISSWLLRASYEIRREVFFFRFDCRVATRNKDAPDPGEVEQS